MAGSDVTARRVQRQQAQSREQISYSGAAVITSTRRTDQTHLEVTRQYIKRSSGDRLSLKLSYWKKRQGAFRVGFPAEFTLDHDEAKELKRVIEEGLAVAHAGENGNFLILQLDGENTSLSGRDPTAVGQALAPLLANREVLQGLASAPDGNHLIAALHVTARLNELRSAIDDLRTMLDGGEGAEQRYQEWSERHSWAFGSVYTMRDDVRNIALGDSVDGLLALTSNGLRDIYELKRPDMSPLSYDKDHRSYYWTRDAAMAIGQCHRYLDAMHQFAATGLRDNPEIVAYHPRATIVMGRSDTWEQGTTRALHGLNARLHGISVMTYDHLLAQAEVVVKTLHAADSDRLRLR